MNKYKLSNGLAIAPEKDMKMLEKMSRNGWHLIGMKGIRYKFESGEKHEYIYNLNTEDYIDENTLSLYESSGWKLIVSGFGYQIFRSEKGTTPIFTDSESKLEVLINNCKKFGIASTIWISLFIISLYLHLKYSGIPLLIVTLCLMCCSIFTFFPFIGLCISIIKTKRNI